MNSLRIIAATALFTLVFMSGFAAGRSLPPISFKASMPDKVLINRAAIVERLASASMTLANCKPLRKKYRARWKHLFEVLAKPIGFGYDPKDDVAIAYAIPAMRSIWLTPAYFAQSVAEQERTIAHELLHLAGFPQHNPKNNFLNDQTYQMSDACFPQLPAEAE